MRKLKLQMQITVDGFVAGPEGQLDWMTWEMDQRAARVHQPPDRHERYDPARPQNDARFRRALGKRRDQAR